MWTDDNFSFLDPSTSSSSIEIIENHDKKMNLISLMDPRRNWNGFGWGQVVQTLREPTCRRNVNLYPDYGQSRNETAAKSIQEESWIEIEKGWKCYEIQSITRLSVCSILDLKLYSLSSLGEWNCEMWNSEWAEKFENEKQNYYWIGHLVLTS
jgi:hypothetical protein